VGVLGEGLVLSLLTMKGIGFYSALFDKGSEQSRLIRLSVFKTGGG
jgi:hypothetical protein